MREFIDIFIAKTRIFSLLLLLGIYFPIFLIIGLILLWVNGAIIDQAKYYPKRRSLAESFRYSGSRYLTIFCASILYGIIMAIAASPPYIGFLISFVANLILFYVYQAIIVDKKACIDSFKKSFSLFSKYPLETFIVWLATAIISLMIIAIFGSPLLFFVFSKLTGTFRVETYTGMEAIKNMIPVISNAIRSPYFIVYLFILCVGLAYAMAFQIGMRTRLYINAKKIEL
jgi:hypothetical protein